jgi:hypothetical protein
MWLVYFDRINAESGSDGFTFCGALRESISKEPYSTAEINVTVHGTSPSCGWRKGRSGMESGCEYIADSRQGIAVQLGGWA